MDSFPLPSLDLDEFMKLDGMLPMGPGLQNSQGPMSYPLLDDFDLPPLSPTGVLLPPVVALPNQLGGPQSLPSSEGSGGTDSPMGQETAPPADTKERVRAKNRRAQSRYREKQKNKRKETEDALDQMTEDVERLTLENARLGTNVDLMEKVLAYRDNAASLLDASKAEEDKKKGPSPNARNIFKRLLPSCPGTEKSGGGDCSTQGTAASRKFDSNGIEIETINPTNSSRPCPMENFSRADVLAFKHMGNDVVQSRYKRVATTLTDALSELDDPRAGPHTKATAQTTMMETLWECGAMCFEYAVLKPTAMQNLLAVSVGEDSIDERTPAAKWVEITRKLELTSEQSDRLQPLREVFVQRAKRIGSRRKEILAVLQGQKPAQSAEDGLASLKVSSAATLNWLALHELTTELEASMQEEHVACMEFVAKAFGGVLTPLQKAKAVVASYPAFPDVFAIAVAAGEERNLLGNGQEAAASAAEQGGAAGMAGGQLVAAA